MHNLVCFQQIYKKFSSLQTSGILECTRQFPSCTQALFLLCAARLVISYIFIICKQDCVECQIAYISMELILHSRHFKVNRCPESEIVYGHTQPLPKHQAYPTLFFLPLIYCLFSITWKFFSSISSNSSFLRREIGAWLSLLPVSYWINQHTSLC